MKISKSPRRVLQVAYEAACQALPAHRHKFSLKKFTQPQLLACLVLKEFARLDYRGLAEHFADHPDLGALTGTIIGGYANHLFPLMIRLNPRTLRDEGFEWGKDLAFTETYGRIDRIVTTREDDPGGPNVRKNVKSMRRARSGKANERKAVRPGVMPTLFGRHLIGSSMFITLQELASELPDLFEYIGGPFVPTGDRDRDARAQAGWVDVACDMLPAQKAEYDRVTAILECANKVLLRKGSMKLLGAYLWTAMDYPDRPWGWDHDKELLKAFEQAQSEIAAEKGPNQAARLRLGHTVGYWERPGVRTLDNFVGVARRRGRLSRGTNRPTRRSV